MTIMTTLSGARSHLILSAAVAALSLTIACATPPTPTPPPTQAPAATPTAQPAQAPTAVAAPTLPVAPTTPPAAKPTVAAAQPAAGSAPAATGATSAATAAPAAAKPAPAGVPAGWQTVKHPNADCQVAVPGEWQSLPENAMAQIPGKASAVVGPSTPAEANVLKESLKQQQGATLLADTPNRWVAEIPNPAGGAAYYVFWSAGAGGCFFTLQATAEGARELGPAARQIAQAAGAGR